VTKLGFPALGVRRSSWLPFPFLIVLVARAGKPSALYD
jgi:hypothetical protein